MKMIPSGQIIARKSLSPKITGHKLVERSTSGAYTGGFHPLPIRPSVAYLSIT
jgi:hypothetical protein